MNEARNNNLRQRFLRLLSLLLSSRYVWMAVVVLVAAVVLAAVLMRSCRQAEQSAVDISVGRQIDITPQQIERIKAIGEWEFLSVVDEEMVDTTRRGFFTDDHLVRIYYGTLRLGINLHQASPGWLKAEGDSLSATLPPVGLLSRDFIDEARTRSFHESGRWTSSDREHLYQKAYRQMLARCLTDENLSLARQQGEQQFRRFLSSLGLHRVRIEWQ